MLTKGASRVSINGVQKTPTTHAVMPLEPQTLVTRTIKPSKLVRATKIDFRFPSRARVSPLARSLARSRRDALRVLRRVATRHVCYLVCQDGSSPSSSAPAINAAAYTQAIVRPRKPHRKYRENNSYTPEHRPTPPRQKHGRSRFITLIFMTMYKIFSSK